MDSTEDKLHRRGQAASCVGWHSVFLKMLDCQGESPPHPVRKIILQMHTPACTSQSCSQKPGMDSEGASGWTWSTARATACFRDRPPPE